MSTKSDSPLLYGELEEWKDITPIPQEEEGFAPLAPILYGEEYKDATSYFRAIVKKGEHSQRVLDLTEHIIRLNPSHYTVWQYRYDTLIATHADLKAELALMDDIATKFLKTYQVWHHRRLLLSAVHTPSRELAFIARGLQEEDSKNYHTWAYRQWILSEFNEDELWEGEVPFVEGMIGADVRNNSAWHHRFFVIWDSGVHSGRKDRDEVLKDDLSFVKYKISLAPNNASAWNYLRGILEFTKTPFSSLEPFIIPYTQPQAQPHNPTADTKQEQDNTEQVQDLENPHPSSSAQLPCAQALEFLATIHIEKMKMSKAEGGANKDEHLDAANKLYDSLATQYDPMRVRFWEFQKREAASALLQAAA